MAAFKKGQSGNPKGRPKGTGPVVEIKVLAATHTERAVERLVYWMNSDNPRASVSAASILLDRAHGKAPQQIAIDAALRECRFDAEPLTMDEWDAKYLVIAAPNRTSATC